MKIGLVCPHNLWRSGGVQECVLALHYGLSKKGHTVKIITPQPFNQRIRIPQYVILAGNAKVINMFSTSSQVSATIDINAIEIMLKDEQFDVLHLHEPWTPMIGIQLLMKSNALNVATFHSVLPKDPVTQTVSRALLPYAKSVQKYIDVVTAVSEPAAYNPRYVRPDAPVNIIPNGVDLKLYKPLRHTTAKSKNKTILYIGRLEKRKGVKYLLRAFGQFANQHKDVKLTIVGDGPERSKLEEYVTGYGLKSVRFIGHVSQKRKVSLLQKADLFCSPALFGESFGIVLLEAMACGIPTVAGDNPGYRSVLSDVADMSLVNPQDKNAFSAQLQRMLFDDQLRKNWKKWALNKVKQYDYPRIVNQYEDLYIKNLNKKQK